MLLMKSAYPVNLSICSGLSKVSETHVFTDVGILVQGWSLFLNPKNPNRSWIVSGEVNRPKAGFIVWPGHLPYSFNTLRAILQSKISRCSLLKLSYQAQFLRLIEDIYELLVIGYPLKLLRKLVHSLPPAPPALKSRQFLRLLCRAEPPQAHGGSTVSPEHELPSTVVTRHEMLLACACAWCWGALTPIAIRLEPLSGPSSRGGGAHAC